MYYTSSIWSHDGGFFTEHGNVIDATTRGVLEHPFSDYFDNKSYIRIIKIRDDVVTPERREQLLSFMRSQIGCSYNWRGVRRFFWSIILGFDRHYRFRFSADFLILLLVLLFPLSFFSRPLGLILIGVGIVYLLVVVGSSARRRKMRRDFAAQIAQPPSAS